MPDSQTTFQIMSMFTVVGERKYLSPAERKRFYETLPVVEDTKQRLFAELIFWTGCRPSEALDVVPLTVDLDEGFVIFRSRKKRGKLKGRHFRPVPVPFEFMTRLDQAFGIRKVQERAGHDQSCDAALLPLWRFSRTKGWDIVKSVMKAANLTGAKACSCGLRHALGVHAVIEEVPESRVQTWLGHANGETTAIYMNATGPEDRALARRTWQFCKTGV